MLRVGLTGGAAGGKSAAATIFRELGAFVSQSDEIARAMMEPGEPLFLAIVQHFGTAVQEQDGRLDRRKLAQIAFEQGHLEELNALVHPPVIEAQQRWMQQVGAEHPEAVAIVESALLLETRHHAGAAPETAASREAAPHGAPRGAEAPWRTRFDRIVLVTAPEKLRMERYLARALASDPAGNARYVEQDARLRFAAQMPETEKEAFADVVIRNDGSREQLRSEIEKVYRALKAEAR